MSERVSDPIESVDSVELVRGGGLWEGRGSRRRGWGWMG